MQRKIPGYLVQINIQDQLTAAGNVFDVVRNMTAFATEIEEDREIQEFFRDLVQRLLRIGDTLKRSASTLGDQTVTSVVPITLISDNIKKQLQISRLIFGTVQDIAKFARSTRMNEELLSVLETSARNLIDTAETLARSASETGEQLLSVAVD